MKVLVTSSTGLTGKAVVKSLSQAGVSVRAMIHSESRRDEMLSVGAAEVAVAAIDSEHDLRMAMAGVDTVFYICPTGFPDEGRIGCMAVDIAAELGIERFVYQSVYNSIEPALIHHREKLQVEQHLLESGLHYSILRPAAFMQNILTALPQVVKDHIFAQRFFTDEKASNRINLISVDDYAAAAAIVTTGSGYLFGAYDLCGPRNLSVTDMLDALSSMAGSEVKLRYITDAEFEAGALKSGMSANKVRILQAMFHAYNRFGFRGNDYVSTTLLGRKPKDFTVFLQETR